MVSTLEATRAALADEWAMRSPSTVEEIASFYRDSERLRDDLEAWHATPERQAWTQAIAAVASANKVTSVLDVGAGTGADLLAAGAVVPAARLMAVEPNRVMRDALTVPSVEDITSLHDAYDMVICIDVLEHVPDPDTLLAQVIDRVALGGLLIEAHATHDQSTPLHLPELEGWHPDAMIRSAGFTLAEQVGRLAVWQRQRIVDEATVVVVAHREIAAPTVECLFGLIAFDWPVMLHYGDALIDRARAKAVAQWYKNETTDVFLMIDDDIVFTPEEAARVVQLAREKRSIACGAYPVGDGGHMASRGWPGQELHWGPTFEPVEIRWPATGFMACHRDVITALIGTMDECYKGQPDSFWPMFTPFAFGDNYLSEDYAFGERARVLGFATWLDPKTILHHLKIQALSVLNMRGVHREGEAK